MLDPMTTPEPASDCLFCKIVAGEIPGDIVHADDTTVAFRDVTPQAPTHVLVVPRSHYATAAELAANEPGTTADLVTTAAIVAADEGLEGGYRLVFNTGPDASQSVQHAHLHMLGGRSMHWPPG